MTPNLGTLLVRPALKKWLVENDYGWIEDYPIDADVTVDVYASSHTHQHAMAVLPVRAVTPATLPGALTTCRRWRAELAAGVVAVAVPADGIGELSRLKLVAANVRVIVLSGTMTRKQYDQWLSAQRRVPVNGFGVW